MDHQVRDAAKRIPVQRDEAIAERTQAGFRHRERAGVLIVHDNDCVGVLQQRKCQAQVAGAGRRERQDTRRLGAAPHGRSQRRPALPLGPGAQVPGDRRIRGDAAPGRDRWRLVVRTPPPISHSVVSRSPDSPGGDAHICRTRSERIQNSRDLRDALADPCPGDSPRSPRHPVPRTGRASTRLRGETQPHHPAAGSQGPAQTGAKRPPARVRPRELRAGRRPCAMQPLSPAEPPRPRVPGRPSARGHAEAHSAGQEVPCPCPDSSSTS